MAILLGNILKNNLDDLLKICYIIGTVIIKEVVNYGKTR